MFVATTEVAVNLTELDPHLKAILKTRIREFIYLHPCFEILASGLNADIAPEPGENYSELGSDADFEECVRISLETAKAKLQLERLYSAQVSFA